ncbi:MAG: hypothetical protein PHE25_00470 [Candidatus Gracilibacteria bacterium]|nr:hypothetical protein [Candidatus Gracilibacteria bacterium]
MKDIFDIKANVLPDLINLNYSLIYIFFIILVLIFIYFKKRKPQKIEIEEIDYKKIQIDFIKLLEDISKNYINSQKEIFYKKLKSFIILFLEYKTKSNISQMTLSELEKIDFTKDLKEIFKEIYFRQYSEILKEDSENYRKEILERISKVI